MILFGALALYKNYLLYNTLEDLAGYLCFIAEKLGSLKPLHIVSCEIKLVK